MGTSSHGQCMSQLPIGKLAPLAESLIKAEACWFNAQMFYQHGQCSSIPPGIPSPPLMHAHDLAQYVRIAPYREFCTGHCYLG